MHNSGHTSQQRPQILHSKHIRVPHGMFNRHSGTSSPPFASLNASYGVGDEPGDVAANREIIKNAVGAAYILSAIQTHGDNIYHSPDIRSDTEVEGYDALVTDQPGIALLVQQADCQAILLHDPARHAIGAVHCGWRGSAANIIQKTIAAMRSRYATDPSDLHAAISPSLGPCCAEFINFREELPERFHPFQDNKHFFNFWDISLQQLAEAGVRQENVSVSSTCTCCNSDYFSYRRSTKKGEKSTGRNCSVICLPGA